MVTNCDDQVEPIMAIHRGGNVQLCSGPPVPLTSPCQCYLPPLPEILTAKPDWQCGRGIADWLLVRFFHLTAPTTDQVATSHLFISFAFQSVCLSTLAGLFQMCLPGESAATITSPTTTCAHLSTTMIIDQLDSVSTDVLLVVPPQSVPTSPPQWSTL